ncbi:MAG TPA: hypothetical protein VFT75_18845 [Nocardioidaceae bacterium]|nr:hypothetical protein [Nocardioidaceae bacterium]
MPTRVLRRWRPASYFLLLVCALLLAGCTTERPAHVAGSNRAGVIGAAPAHARARTPHHHRSHHHQAHGRARHRAHRTTQPATRPKPHLAKGVPGVDLPNRNLTPGVVLTTRASRVCTPGYASSVRDVPSSESQAVYARYGVVHVPYAHEVDHLVSLELGGSNAIANLWPEPYAGRWGARTKDVLENRLHDLVCSGQLGLRRAQRLEATDWVAAYRRFVGGTPTADHSTPASTTPDNTTAPAAPPPTSSSGSCEPGYSPCLPVTSNLDCGDIPDSEKPVHVTGDDPYRLDGDGDGLACE